MRSCVQSSKLVNVSGVHCHMRASSTSSCVLCTLQYCIEYSSTVSYFKPRIFRSKGKSSSDVAGTAEEPKTFMTQEMARGFSLFEEALLVFEALDPDVEWDMKIVTAVQNAIQCYCVIYDEEKRATTQTSLDHFLKRVNRI